MSGWQLIYCSPESEDTPFLVLVPNVLVGTCVVQVSMFQGDMYPDHMEGNIDWGDRIQNATHWMPLPAAPAKEA